MEGKFSLSAALAASVFALAAAPAVAQSPAEFYKGKTVQFSVGYAPGGGFDAYTRAAARFMGRHIPGNPNVIVTNMPGASSLTFVRHLQNIAPKDGTQFGMFNRGLIPKSVLEPKEVGVDFTNFTWIGSMNSELVVCYTWGARGLKNLADIRKSKVTLGETSRNSGGYIYTSILRSMIPDSIRPVMGYANTGDIWLAMERGEIDGNCTVLTSIQAQRPEWWSKRLIDIHLQFAETKHKDLPDVPTIFERVESDLERQAINFLIASEAIGRPVIAPPGIPADRAQALRKAFVDTMNDPEFLAFATKANMEIDVVTGERAAKIVTEIKNTPREAVERARKLME